MNGMKHRRPLKNCMDCTELIASDRAGEDVKNYEHIGTSVVGARFEFEPGQVKRFGPTR